MKKLYEEPVMETMQFYVEEKIMSVENAENEISPYVATPGASGWGALDDNTFLA